MFKIDLGMIFGDQVIGHITRIIYTIIIMDILIIINLIGGYGIVVLIQLMNISETQQSYTLIRSNWKRYMTSAPDLSDRHRRILFFKINLGVALLRRPLKYMITDR